MKYGCIGKKLAHSFSKDIHSYLASRDYELTEVQPEDLHDFMTRRDFCGINVTIPYKQAVIPYLDNISEEAERIGAVNTIVNNGGKLSGYNTDLGGMCGMLQKAGIDLLGRKVLILGTGGTSNTAHAAAEKLGAAQIYKVSRTGRDGACTYQQAYSEHADAQIIINTTPCGMYPDSEDMPIESGGFKHLEGVADVIFNPLRTRLVLQAQKTGINACGGLYMLVGQAVLASQIFTGVKYTQETIDDIYGRIHGQKLNIVLIGMPGCGKSTIGRLLADRLKRPFIDTDDVIVRRKGMPITDIFAQEGQQAFRALEKEVIRECCLRGGSVIATGGGAVIDAENTANLASNGRIYFLDRPLEQLVPTDSRPLASDRTKIENLYKERYGIYRAAADRIIEVNGAERTSAAIEEDFCK